MAVDELEDEDDAGVEELLEVDDDGVELVVVEVELELVESLVEVLADFSALTLPERESLR